MISRKNLGLVFFGWVAGFIAFAISFALSVVLFLVVWLVLLKIEPKVIDTWPLLFVIVELWWFEVIHQDLFLQLSRPIRWFAVKMRWGF